MQLTTREKSASNSLRLENDARYISGRVPIYQTACHFQQQANYLYDYWKKL